LEKGNKGESREDNYAELSVLELIKRIEQLAAENAMLRKRLEEAGVSQ